MVFKWSNSELYFRWRINSHLTIKFHPFLKHLSFLLPVFLSSVFVITSVGQITKKYFPSPLNKAAMFILNLVYLQAFNQLHNFEDGTRLGRITWLPMKNYPISERANNASLIENQPKFRVKDFEIRHGVTLRQIASHISCLIWQPGHLNNFINQVLSRLHEVVQAKLNRCSQRNGQLSAMGILSNQACKRIIQDFGRSYQPHAL